MKSLHESFSLAKEMVDIGNEMGKRTSCNNRYGSATWKCSWKFTGSYRAIETLKGNGPVIFMNYVLT